MDEFKKLKSKLEKRWPGLSKLKFSEWVLWNKRSVLKDTNRVGVYILAKYESNYIPDKVEPTDEKIIYIGKTNIGRTTTLKKRLRCFDREAFGKGASHSGASSYKMHYGKVHSDLYVSICPIFWSNEGLNKLTTNKKNYDAWIYKSKPEKEPFIIHLLVNWLEVCLRGLYVYKWGRLPICNKE